MTRQQQSPVLVAKASSSQTKHRPAGATLRTAEAAAAAACSRCQKTFGSQWGLQKHYRDSGKHLDHPGNQHHLLLAKMQRGMHDHNAGQPSSSKHVSDTLSTPASTTGSTSTTGAANSNHNLADTSPTTVQPGPANKKSKYQLKKAKKRQKALRDVPPVSLIADRGHDEAVAEHIISQKATATTSEDIEDMKAVNIDKQALAVNTEDQDNVSEGADSEDESAYFTSEEVDEPPLSTGSESIAPQKDNIKASEAPFDYAATKSSDSGVSDSAVQVRPSETHESPLTPSIIPSNDAPPRSESRASSSIYSDPSFNWDQVLQSSIPRDIYEMSDSGVVHCKPCSKWFTTFREFEQHYATSEEHRPRSDPSRLDSLLESTQDGPPPLVRVTDEAPLPRLERASPPVLEASSTSVRTRHEKNSRGRGSTVAPSHTCVKCSSDFANLTALQRHKASSTREHPYYCQYCTEEYDTFEHLQIHYQYSRQCQVAQPSAAGPESTLFNYQDYQASQRLVEPRPVPARPQPVTRNLPTHTGITEDSASSTINGPSCPICISPLTDVSDATATFCGHVFCAPCILEHLRTRNNCPRCRKLISPMMLIPLFL